MSLYDSERSVIHLGWNTWSFAGLVWLGRLTTFRSRLEEHEAETIEIVRRRHEIRLRGWPSSTTERSVRSNKAALTAASGGGGRFDLKNLGSVLVEPGGEPHKTPRVQIDRRLATMSARSCAC